MVRLKFQKIREEILKRIKRKKKPQKRQQIIGRRREELVAKALSELKENKVVIDGERIVAEFIAAGNLSFVDVMKGCDFYVVSISEKKGKRILFYLSVTGKHWIENDRKKYPENIHIAIEPQEDIESVKNKIIEAILDRLDKLLVINRLN